ncbi:zinc-binding dehydrogenase [Dokdonia sp. Hel_I_53]|uniref:zinc-binding dehydrogenase n=1 Tax=Dokdonia sp. Hel_I_53 TaxID=1566287 RepID=UPI0028F40325|nr:zinc-binding dehydrogenase [Dokdonia sp. Hel_I_53]
MNYNTTSNMKAALKEACPNGIDVYYDNVGGETAEAVMYLINKNARIINCGAISMYNDKKMPQLDAVQPFLVRKSALMQGFIVSNYQDEFGKGMQQLGQWLKEGKLTYKQTIVEGFENIPQAFLDLFTGENVGKMIVKV